MQALRKTCHLLARSSPAVILLLSLLPGAVRAAMPTRPVLPGVGTRDDRAVVDPNRAPWRAVGRVQTELGGRCTGFLVAPRTVVTAAHCLFLPRPRNFLQPGSVHFVTGYALGRYAGHSVATRFTIAPGYDPLHEDRTAGADWAVLTLAVPLGTADRRLPLAAAVPAGGAVMLGGYGQDREEVMDADTDCAVSGRSADGDGRALLVHTCSATRGTSGAPLLARSADGGWEVIGVQIAAAPGQAGGFAVPVSAIRLSAGASAAERGRSASTPAPLSDARAAGRSR